MSVRIMWCDRKKQLVSVILVQNGESFMGIGGIVGDNSLEVCVCPEMRAALTNSPGKDEVFRQIQHLSPNVNQVFISNN